jgi:hypothetical protein
MSTYTYKTILKQAQTCHKNVSKNHKTGMWSWWGYYFAKALLNPKKDVTVIKIDNTDSKGDYFSQLIGQGKYLSCAKYLTEYCEKHHKMPKNIPYNGKHINNRLFTYLMAKGLIAYNELGKYKTSLNLNSKVFTAPTETTNEVYNYFVKVFGKFDNTIDGALSKIDGNGYGGYSDDRYSNKTSIDRMKNQQGINCTDSCHVFYNIMKQLIALGKYKKVECLHVRCSSGVGHVRLRITMNDGSKILRDPASVLDGNGITSNWCTSNYELWGIDPDWFMSNLNR